MERVNRVFERLSVQPEDRPEPRVAVMPASPMATPVGPELTETVMLQTPVISLSELTRERHRILPPGAAGPHGGPYKMLRTQVLKRLDKLGATTLGVLSPASGDGKTLTAINLAIAIAADPEHTVLLVDFDLRSPAVAERFGHVPPIGVGQCLQQRRHVREAMFKLAGYERLTVVAAEGRIEDSSELLSSAQIAAVVEEMRTRYANRFVIFDLPPVLQADDALAFSRNLQAGLLVVGEGKTRRDEVTRTLALLHDLPFVGTVLNGSKSPERSYY